MEDSLLASLLKPADDSALLQSVKALSNLMDDAYGQGALDLAAQLRRAGAVARLCDLLDHSSPRIHRRAMAILGNLLTDVFEPLASESLKLAKVADVLPKLLSHLNKKFPGNMYAVACLQNITSLDGESCDYLQKHGAAPILEAMLAGEDAQVPPAAHLPRPSKHGPLLPCARAVGAVRVGHAGQHAEPRCAARERERRGQSRHADARDE